MEFSFVWLPGWQLPKWSLHLTAASSNDGDVEVNKDGEWSLQSLANDWQRWASCSHPQLCGTKLLWQLICNDWEDNLIAFKKQIRGFLFRMLPPAGLLISRDEKKDISENRWANLLQVRLSGSCYATHQGRMGSCWDWVGRGRTDGKLRADGQQTWEKPTHSISTAHMHCGMMD